MGIDFHWTDEPAPPSKPPEPRRRVRRKFLLVLLLGTLVGLGWIMLRGRGTPSTAAVDRALNELLTRERDAFQTGDGPAFFALQPEDAAWRSAQLWPSSLAMHRAGRRLVSSSRQRGEITAQIGWEDGDGSQTRMAFFVWDEGALVPVAAAPWYWRGTVHRPVGWGTFDLPENDQEWATEIESFVMRTLDEACAATCLHERLPFRLALTTTYAATAAPGTVVVPSPRLMALDESGMPAPAFWRMLEARLLDYLTPAKVRFAVPPAEASNYEAAAQRFHDAHPEIDVTIVPVDELSTADLAAVDGALIVPTADQVAAGAVADLAPFAATDLSFEADDFHPLLRRGVEWHDGWWAVPIGGRVSLFHSDARAYGLAGLPPAPPTSWLGLEGQIVQLRNAAGNELLQLPFADFTGDSLRSVAGAYHCGAAEPCSGRLSAGAIQQALSWYAGVMAAQPDSPDLAQLPAAARRNYALNNLSRPREIAAWIDSPTYYEHNVQIAPLGLAALPPVGDATSTPVQVLGGVISAASARPRAVWAWLDFLSRERPLNEPRALPGRVSVAEEIGFWQKMPVEVRTPMEAAFADGRVVRLDESTIFRPAIIGALLAGETTTTELAERALELQWFGEVDRAPPAMR